MADPTSLRTIARRCIDENGTITLGCFSLSSPDVATYWNGYCAEHAIGVALMEAARTTPEDKGRCIAEAIQDRDLEAAFARLGYLYRFARYNAVSRLERDFVVVLLREIKAELNERNTDAHA
ncbi:hypothetical protein EOL96_03770 [Candidatus Saccharibacteria bacterium]|nr:hypothetical protein [Candidatus Saccharibacteria bacterium]